LKHEKRACLVKLFIFDICTVNSKAVMPLAWASIVNTILHKWTRRDERSTKWTSLSTRFAVNLKGITRLGSAFMFLRWFKLAHQATAQIGRSTRRNQSALIFLIGNGFHVTLRIPSPKAKYKISRGNQEQHIDVAEKSTNASFCDKQRFINVEKEWNFVIKRSLSYLPNPLVQFRL